MNEDKMISMLGSLDDDLLDNVIDELMEGVDFDLASIDKKARQKLAKHQRQAVLKRRLPYVAAVLLLFVSINTVYADDISQVIKKFFNKTPVYETMVDGQAYYLEKPKVADKDLTIDSFLVTEGRLEMSITSDLDPAAICKSRIVPKNAPDTAYFMGGYSEDGDDKYSLSFMNEKEQNYDIKPFQSFDLQVGGKTYSVKLDQAKSLDASQKLASSEATTNKIDQVTVGANSIEKNGKQAIQLIASFKEPEMKLTFFGKPKTNQATADYENLGKYTTGGGGPARPEPVYAIDQAGVKHQLTQPAYPKAYPVTTFDTDAPKDSKLTVKLPALIATYEKIKIAQITFSIPQQGEQSLKQEVDLVAQKAVLKSVKRLSPTSAELTFALNTGADKNISISTFSLNSPDIKKYSAEFNGDSAVVTMEFFKEAPAYNIDISWPYFIMNGNWTINLK